jgi:hypothetical protein
MGTPETRTWSILLDGRIQEITLEIERSIWDGHTWRIAVNGSHAVTSKASLLGVKFKIGKHKAKIRHGTLFSGYAISLLIDDVDASE